jgi:hypothetical protein
MGADASYIYGPDDYFAFVESFEPLARSVQRGGKSNDERIQSLQLERRPILPVANSALWLDCVQAQYFMQLPWKDEVCRIGDASDSAKRRKQLQNLDRTKFLVGLLLIHTRGTAEAGTAAELAGAAWHRISLTSSGGLPVITGTDFDLEDEGRRMRQLRYLGRCSLLERKSLTNAFSLDFLPDAKFGTLERGNPDEPPRGPKWSPNKEKIEWDREHREQRQPVPVPQYQYAKRR